MRLKDKVCIITGGGNGQGRAASELFAQEGASVVIADFDENAGIETAEEIKKKGLRAVFVKVDVSKEKEVETMIKFAVDTFGKLNVLYNNAGISSRTKGDGNRVENIPEEAWDHNHSVNLKGVFFCIKHAIPEMIKNGQGSIINTSSISGVNGGWGIGPYFGKYPVGGPIAYTAAKSGLIMMTKSLAITYGQYNIRANVICPGQVDTQLMKPLNLEKPEIKESLTNAIPRRRIAQPIDIANAALFFASDESDFVTAQVLCVDGGITAY